MGSITRIKLYNSVWSPCAWGSDWLGRCMDTGDQKGSWVKAHVNSDACSGRQPMHASFACYEV